MVSEAIAEGDIQAVNYFVATRYVDAIQSLASAPNQKVLFLPLEASSVIGSLGGLAEIAKETFGGGPDIPAKPRLRRPSSGDRPAARPPENQESERPSPPPQPSGETPTTPDGSPWSR